MDFEKKLKLRRALLIAFIIIGFVSVALGLVRVFFTDDHVFLSYYFGTGVGLIVAGIINLKRTITALSNKDKMENLRIEEYDEWNTVVRYRAAYYAVCATMITLYALSLIFLFIHSDLFLPFIIADAILIVFFFTFMLVLRKIK